MIVHSDLLLEYLKKNYPGLYFVSSTTKVLTDFEQFLNEVNRKDFQYVVPDFRLNKSFDKLNTLSQTQKDKVEFLSKMGIFGGNDGLLLPKGNLTRAEAAAIFDRSFNYLQTEVRGE